MWSWIACENMNGFIWLITGFNEGCLEERIWFSIPVAGEKLLTKWWATSLSKESLLCEISYRNITPTNFQPFCVTTFSSSLTSLMALLLQSRDYRDGHWCFHCPDCGNASDLPAHEFAHSPNSCHQPRLANFTYSWCWRLCGITSAVSGLWMYSSNL